MLLLAVELLQKDVWRLRSLRCTSKAPGPLQHFFESTVGVIRAVTLGEEMKILQPGAARLGLLQLLQLLVHFTTKTYFHL